jgi:hypothetical protein
MNTRMSYEIKMNTEKLQQIFNAVKNAAEHMTEGQVLRIEIAHNVDFVFYGLKPFVSTTASSRETEIEKQTLIN